MPLMGVAQFDRALAEAKRAIDARSQELPGGLTTVENS
jgi:hypothetical protein